MPHRTPSPLPGGSGGLGSVSRGVRPWQQLGGIVLLLLLVLLPRGEASPAQLCRGIRCFNGGSLEVHGSLFGSCRCVCPNGFVGMTCQYMRVGRKRGESEGQSQSQSQSQGQSTAEAELYQRYRELRDILLQIDALAQTLPAATSSTR